MSDSLQYIAVEGPIGVGKTTLTQLLAKEFNYRLVLEEAENNPFLPDFYKDQKKFAFQTQTYFLLSRYQQQRELNQQDLFKQGIVSDYIFAKDKIFASLNLSQDELLLYESIYQLLDTRIAKPDLVIFLQASTEVLKERIKKRKIPHEKHIHSEYLENLAQSYNHFFFSYNETPLLVVNCSEIDFANSPEDYQNLLNEIFQMKKQKLKKHYVSISSR